MKEKQHLVGDKVTVRVVGTVSEVCMINGQLRYAVDGVERKKGVQNVARVWGDAIEREEKGVQA